MLLWWVGVGGAGWGDDGSKAIWDLASAVGWPLCHDPQSARNVTPCPTALTVATPFETIYLGIWSYNCVLSCIAIGGMFYALTWQTHLLALVCGGYQVTLLFLVPPPSLLVVWNPWWPLISTEKQWWKDCGWDPITGGYNGGFLNSYVVWALSYYCYYMYTMLWSSQGNHTYISSCTCGRPPTLNNSSVITWH